MDDYYSAAVDVSRRLIAGETGERLVDAHGRDAGEADACADLVKTVTAFEPGELAAAFTPRVSCRRTVAASASSSSIAALLLVVLLSSSLGRSVVKALSRSRDRPAPISARATSADPSP